MFLEINRFVDPLVKLLGDDFLWLSEISIGSILVRLILIIIFSGIIGIERASKRHEAGLRTYILVCVGSAIAMLTNQFIYEMFNTGDASRIAAQVISGIGFLGAGTILITSRNQIKGLTTAAGLWACACMGISIGVGFYSLTIVGFVLIFVVLLLLPNLEKKLTKLSKNIKIHIELQARTDLKELIYLLRENDFKILSIERNNAYANSGLSVYSIDMSKLKNNEFSRPEILKFLNDLPYVCYVEEIN